jgi:D-glycero-alpha-D-manno-heptose-7-phosphate kinase
MNAFKPVVSSCPLRVSLIGGGTDMPEYVERSGRGCVISFPLAQEVHAVVMPNTYPYRDLRLQNSCDNALTHAVVDFLEDDGVKLCDVAMFSDVDTCGTGLGSSAAWIRALLRVNRRHDYTIKQAYDVERSVGSRCGYQDHAVAWRQVPAIYSFTRAPGERPGEVMFNDHPIPNFNNILPWLRFYRIGGKRDSNVILARQGDAVKDHMDGLDYMMQLTDSAIASFQRDDMRRVAKIISESWEIKKKYAPGVTNDDIDAALKIAVSHGAVGGKILGAGSAGYLMVLMDPIYSEESRTKLNAELYNELHIPRAYLRAAYT